MQKHRDDVSRNVSRREMSRCEKFALYTRYFLLINISAAIYGLRPYTNGPLDEERKIPFPWSARAMDLTTRERQTFEAIRELSKSGLPPRIADVMQAIGSRSSRVTKELIDSLRDKGLLIRWPAGRQHRAILLTPEALKAAA
jgi:hypothetical protein